MGLIESFVEESAGLSSPKEFSTWGAISLISALLQRKCWIQTRKGKSFARLYLFLVGPAASGKTQIIKECRRLIEFMGEDEYPILANDISRASLVDSMRDAECTPFNKLHNEFQTYNFLYLPLRELSSLIGKDPYGKSELIDMLTDIFDSDIYVERKRTAKTSIRIEKLAISFIAGTTPSYLNSYLPPSAWDEGFMSRVIMIYGDKVQDTKDLFAESSSQEFPKTKHHMNRIADECWGAVKVSPEFAEIVNLWRRDGEEPKPVHPKLETYCGRRQQNLLSLCLISCVSESSDSILEPRHFDQALGWLVDAEKQMEYVFKAFSHDSKIDAVKEILHSITLRVATEKRPISRALLFRIVGNYFAPREVAPTINSLVEAQYLKRMTEGNFMPGKNDQF